MATESYYRNIFCAEIIANYSKEKLTNARIQSIWLTVKYYPDEALSSALKEITKPEFFPGADRIIELCSKANAEFKAVEISKARANGECSFCNNGLRQVNNFSYRCCCKIGKLMYPSLVEYDGQPVWADKHYEDDEGNDVFETKTHIYRNKKNSKSLKDYSFTLKLSEVASPKQSEYGRPTLLKANRFEQEFVK